ncbi:MAG TPA: hypothetical protein VFI41_12740 [Gemmatimonadales bacterium]|nr:hypothetical protein [Gemmatimonadales bacterium]
MAFDTYAHLQTEITDLLDRGDLASKVPSWIDLVEAEIQRILQGRDMRTTVALTFDTSGAVALPADYRSPVSLTLETDAFKGPIEITTYERLQTKRGQLVNGQPLYAAVNGSNLLVAPLPDSDTAYTGVLVYDATVAPLSDTNTTNWVLTNHPDIYFYGAALHSAPYLRDDDRIPTWEKFYTKAVDQVRVARDRAEFGVNTPVVRPKSALGS